MNKINWGIIGCGDVTELKSGPAFNKVPDSSLVAVMRRDGEKAKDYARRHGVPRWYDDASKLINDPEVNAIYIATPPSSHEQYTLAAIHAGKPVYVEKPMATDHTSARIMANAAAANNIKLTVAHYRREQPFFKRIKQLLQENVIGDIQRVRLLYEKPALSAEELSRPGNAWRVNPAISGGGLFYDLAPHQLDLLYHFFGPAEEVKGVTVIHEGEFAAHDMVAGTVLFKNGVTFNGAWCFKAPAPNDILEINGSAGKLLFSVFNPTSITMVTKDNKTTTIDFDPLLHVQQPMIEKTVQYFLGNADNPCSGDEGAEIMWMMGEMVGRE